MAFEANRRNGLTPNKDLQDTIGSPRTRDPESFSHKVQFDIHEDEKVNWLLHLYSKIITRNLDSFSNFETTMSKYKPMPTFV